MFKARVIQRPATQLAGLEWAACYLGGRWYRKRIENVSLRVSFCAGQVPLLSFNVTVLPTR